MKSHLFYFLRFLNFIIILFSLSCQKTIIHPHKGQIIEAVYGLGTVESEDVYHAKSVILSSISKFYVKEGQDVLKGQKLFTTDEGVTVKAPFDGRITKIPVAIRENIFPQSIILSLMNLQRLLLSVSLEQQAAMRIKKGMNVEVSFEFFRNRKLKGVVETIFPDQNEFTAKVRIDNWPEGVLPGMTADVAFEISRKNDAVLVPVTSLANGNLIIKRNGKKIKNSAKIGLMDLEYAEILEPLLTEEDEIIIP